jgi:hypothetical protein
VDLYIAQRRFLILSSLFLVYKEPQDKKRTAGTLPPAATV